MEQLEVGFLGVGDGSLWWEGQDGSGIPSPCSLYSFQRVLSIYHVPGPGSGVGEIDMVEILAVP